MKTRQLLLTLLMALAMPLAMNAQVERTLTVYTGLAKNSHVPIEGCYQNHELSFVRVFTLDKNELADLDGKYITKMAFHIVGPVPNPSGNGFFRITLGHESENYYNPVTVTESACFHIDGNLMEFVFDVPFHYNAQYDLRVGIYSYWREYCFFPEYLPQFYGVNDSDVLHAFTPQITFTYQSEATWANTNTPQNVWPVVLDDGQSLRLQWDGLTGRYYQALCVERGTAPNWNNATTVTDAAIVFEGLTSNTVYDMYVRATNPVLQFYSIPVKATCATKRLTNLDNENLELDFQERYMPNGITCTGENHYMVEVVKEYSSNPYSWYDNYYMSYVGNNEVVVNLPPFSFSGASNGVAMEFDLAGAQDVQARFYCRDDEPTDLGTFSASSNWTHYSVRYTGSYTGAQNAYFQLVSSHPFKVDNVYIYKMTSTMRPYDVQASDITANSAVISWEDDNTGSINYHLRYKKVDDTEWQLLDSGITTPYTLGGNTTPLDPYTQYEVQVKAVRPGGTESSEWTNSCAFFTHCPTHQTPYAMGFDGLDELPQYWRYVDVSQSRLSISDDQMVLQKNLYYFYSNLFEAYVILPYFENLGSLQLGFDACRNEGDIEKVQVGLMTNPFDYLSFTMLEEFDLTDTPTHYDLMLADASADYAHIAIHLRKFSTANQVVALDNFMVTRAPEPTNLTVSNVTNTSATLGWTTGAPSVEIRYRVVNGTWTTVTPDANPYTLTGLTNSTNYEAQIRANYGTQYSDWADFDSFKTLAQEPLVMGASNASYYEDFESDSHGWILNNGASTNYWCHHRGAGVPYYNGTMYTYNDSNRSIYITDGTTTGGMIGSRPKWQYTKMDENQFQNIARPSLVYLTKTFDLNAGQYTFNFDYKVMGVEEEDYLRVFLVPANTELEGTGSSSVFPSGYESWFSLDNGTQVAQTPNNNAPTADFVSFGNGTGIHNVVEVRPGGDLVPGAYMMVFAWRNTGTTHSSFNNPVQYPAAIDNVSIAWSPIIYGPTFAGVETTDTEATLILIAPGLGISPTTYEVQYVPTADTNNFVGAPIASFNVTESPQAVTLTGLTPNTSYNFRIRSAYTANGTTIYSDWSGSQTFSTLYPRPTDLAVVYQTTNSVGVDWTPVEIEHSSNQQVEYSWQLTTDVTNWGEENNGVVSASWERNLAVGTYYFRVRAKLYDRDAHAYVAAGVWSEPIEFTIAPWTDPMVVFPLSYDFEASSNIPNGMTLDGHYEHFDIESNFYSGVPAHEGSESEKIFSFNSGANQQAYLVLPPLNPSTSDAMVSFWWYHHSGHQNFPNTNENDGVELEASTNGQYWSPVSYVVIPRYDANFSGWKKYDFVFPATSNPTYLRLHFYGTTGSYLYCYLDDLKVNTFQSYQPYISYVGCDDSSAEITLYDYGYENGWPSSAFQVQYREYRNPGEPEEEWSTYSLFDEEEPAFEHSLVVNGLQPTTLYEFRACARASYGGFDFPWSDYCTPYRQWTDCGTYVITPSYSYTMGFEDEFYLNCWSGNIDETAWHLTTDEAHGGTMSVCCNVANKEVISPTIDLTGLDATTDNVIVRFWAKTTVPTTIVRLRYDSKSTTTVYTINSRDEWKQYELSLCSLMGKEVSVIFRTNSTGGCIYIDDFEVIANPYPNCKIFDAGISSTLGRWDAAEKWYPNGVPTADNDVRVLKGRVWISGYTGAANSVFIGPNGNLQLITIGGELNITQTISVDIANVTYDSNGEVSTAPLLVSQGTVTANAITVSDANSVVIRPAGTINVSTLNPGGANCVVVKNGGLLNATAITTADAGANDRVVIKDGGQVKTDNPFYATIEKDITGYGAENVNNHTGYYLVAPTTQVMAVPTFVPHINSVPQFDQMDFYWFNGNQELEWYNPKCPDAEGCDSPWGAIPQGQFSAEVAQPLKGYLYARQEDGTLQFAAGTMGNTPFSATNVDTSVDLEFYSNSDASFNGWNLIGNPYTCNAYLKQGGSYIPFYKMNDTGDAIVGVAAGTPIKPCEGVFVCCTEPSTVTFTTTEPTGLGQAPEDLTVLLPSHMLYEDQDAGTMVGINLVAGWNWFAPNIETSVGALQSLLGNDAVIQREEGNTNETVVPGQMVKIHVDEEGEFTLTGLPVAANITIGNGINWIGFTNVATTGISATLDMYNIIPAEGDKIISQDQGFAIFNGTSWEGTLTSLEPGKGYVYIR